MAEQGDGTQGTGATGSGGLPPELQGATGAAAQLGWRAQLPDDLKTHDAFTTFKTVGDFGKAYLDTVGKVTDLEGRLASSIPKPAENASPEDMAKFFTALGRPESPDKYQFESVQLPDGFPMDPALETWFRQAAFETGLNSGQASALYKQYMNMLVGKVSDTMAAQARVREEGLNKLYQEWGDKKAENIETIKRTMRQFGSDGLMKYFDETGVGNDPAIVNFFLSVGKAMSEDQFARGGQGGGLQTKTDPKTGMPIFDYPSMKENSGG